MEKLQPLIKHKFWVIAGASLLLPFVGWWLSTGAVADTIQQRWETLMNTKVTPAAGQPNQDYIDKIQNVNKVLADRQSHLDERLYESQKSLHTWPQYVASYMQDKKFREPVDTNVLRIFARNHYDEVRGMLAALPQYKFNQMTGAESGIVAVSIDSVPHVPRSVWSVNPPTSSEMWDTQEDVWLTRAILEAIKEVNGDAGATKISDAPIRMIIKLTLHGGSRPDLTATATPGEGMEGEGVPGGNTGVYTPQFGRRGPGEDVDGMYNSGMSGMSNLQTQINMDLVSIFGPPDAQKPTGGTGEEGAPMDSAPADLPGSTGTAGKTQKEDRYIDEDPALPYKTRGFYLEVLMLHDKLPDLQAALVSMPWPTELLMIHQVSDQFDKVLPVVENSGESTMPGGRGFRPTGGRGGGAVFNPRANFGVGQNRFGLPGAEGGFRRGFGGRGGGGRGGGPFVDPPGMEGGGGFRRPMGPMNPMGPMGLDGENGQQQTAGSTSWDKAMNDFYLARIGIAGLMTIYRSPEEMAAAKAEGQEGGEVSEDPANAAPTEEGQPVQEGQPAEPGSTDPMNPDAANPAQPADGQPGENPMPENPPAEPAADGTTTPVPMPEPGMPPAEGTVPPANEAPSPADDAAPNPNPGAPPPSNGG